MIMLRSAVYNLFFFTVSFGVMLVGLVVRVVAPHRLYDLAVIWARILLGGARVICGIRLQVEGMQHVPQGAALLASRHQSAFDTLVWLTLLPRCCYVLKRELLRIPLFGFLIPFTGMIAVDRDGGGAALRVLMRDGARAARAGKQIVIFPEGTRAAPDTLLPLQPGIAGLAAATKLPVIPVLTDSGHVWGRRAFRKRPGLIRIVVLPPLPAGLPREVLMRRLTETLQTDISRVPTVAAAPDA